MADIQTGIPMLDLEPTDRETFVSQLAEWANQYVWEVAEPVMRQWQALYADPAIVRLLDAWHASNEAYRGTRLAEMEACAKAAEDGGDWSAPPVDPHQQEAGAYGTALRALVIGR